MGKSQRIGPPRPPLTAPSTRRANRATATAKERPSPRTLATRQGRDREGRRRKAATAKAATVKSPSAGAATSKARPRRQRLRRPDRRRAKVSHRTAGMAAPRPRLPEGARRQALPATGPRRRLPLRSPPTVKTAAAKPIPAAKPAARRRLRPRVAPSRSLSPVRRPLRYGESAAAKLRRRSPRRRKARPQGCAGCEARPRPYRHAPATKVC